MINIVEYLKIAIILVGIDSFYLSMISKFFNNQVRLIQGTPIDMRYSAAVLAYVFLTVGMYYYIIVKKISLLEAFGLGIFVYGVYETTNAAIFKRWKWDTVLLDTVWGGILFTLTKYLYDKIKI